MNARVLRFLPLVLLLLSCGGPNPPNVVIVTFDTTRADRIGCYGRTGAHTPNLDELASQGVLFEQCRSAAPVTLPSHSTIMTGTYPNVHGVRDNGLFVLPKEARTLAEILRDRGYGTGAAIGSFVLDRQFGISQGFDFYEDRILEEYEDYWGRRVEPKKGLFFDERPAQHVNDAVFGWLREHANEPFFLWLHYWDPHHPHIPPDPYDQLFAADLYQAEIANADEAFGRLMTELDLLGVAANTVVVFTSDHGEGEGEHGEETHSFLAYDSTVHVPLIVKHPGASAGLRVDQMVGTVDITPTVLDLLGIPLPEVVQGHSLVPLMDGRAGEEAAARSYYAETLAPRTSHGLGELRVWFDGGMKYIHGPKTELYNLASDPRELNDLMAESREVAENLHSELVRYLADSTDSGASDANRAADRETLERLAALGYVTEGGDDPGSIIDELRTDGEPPQDHVAEVNRRSAVRNFLARGDFLDAKEICLESLEAHPDNAFFLAMSAAAHLGLGQIDRAVDEIGRVPQIMSGNTRIVYQVAAATAGQGEWRTALDLVDRALGAALEAEGFGLRAEICRAMGDEKGYLDGLLQALEVDERYVPARTALAVVLAEQGRYDEAAAEMRSAITHDPLNPRSHFNYGKLLIDLGRLDEARTFLERAIELKHDYWIAYLALIAVDVDLNAMDRASVTYERLRDQCSNDDILFRADLILATHDS